MPPAKVGAGIVADENDEEVHFIASVVVSEASHDASHEMCLASSLIMGSLFLGTLQGVVESALGSSVNHLRFGNGQVETSIQQVDLPIGLAGKRGVLQAPILNGEAPCAGVQTGSEEVTGAVIDFSGDLISLFGEVGAPLEINSAGHYMADVLQLPEKHSKTTPPTSTSTGSIRSFMPPDRKHAGSN